MKEYLIAAELLDRAYDEGFLSVFNEYGIGLKVEIPIVTSLWNTDISALMLSSDSLRVLSDNGMKSVGDVVDGIMVCGLESLTPLRQGQVAEIKTAVLDAAYNRLGEKKKAAFWLQIVRRRGLANE